MNSIVLFVKNNIVIISIITYIWFAIDCKIQKKFFQSKFDWMLYIIYSVSTTMTNHGYMTKL